MSHSYNPKYEFTALECADLYKAEHYRQYPYGMEYLEANFTPRSLKHAPDESITQIGNAGTVWWVKQYLIDFWNATFFNRELPAVMQEYLQLMDEAVGHGVVQPQHIECLWRLGYLPLEISALPEGAFVNPGVPTVRIRNTLPGYGWLVTFIETASSSILWNASSIFTISNAFKRKLNKFAMRQGIGVEELRFPQHDFSYRGKNYFTDVYGNIAHLYNSAGSDTTPVIRLAKKYLNAEGLVAAGVIATEHSVMCAGGKMGEEETIKRLIFDLYPKGIVSIVSDTWDYWDIIGNVLPKLKEGIMQRGKDANGLAKVVVRPDSGDPFRVICGYLDSEVTDMGEGKFRTEDGRVIGFVEKEGAIRALAAHFGVRDRNGWMQLNDCIGVIYGEGFNLPLYERVLTRLDYMGYSCNNPYIGIGSYSFNGLTRDSFGFAWKATWNQTNGVSVPMQKDPITATKGFSKTSAYGRVKVALNDGEYALVDESCEFFEEIECEMKTIFRDGVISDELDSLTLEQVRNYVGTY